MKIVCVHHSIDLDGWMSAAIVKYWFYNNPNKSTPSTEDILDFIGYNYGQPIPDLSEYDRVIMCDISFPIDEMFKLYDKLQDNFIWNDHHKSAIIDSINNKYIYTRGLRNDTFAACELTWKYFFPNEKMPEIVRLLGRYDCFGHKETDEELKVLEFQYGARNYITDYESAYRWLIRSLNQTVENTSPEEDIHKIGKHIYSYLCTEAEQNYKNGFVIKFLTDKFICINKERFNPINFGIDYHKDGYDGAACFWFNGITWSFSLYNDNGLVDCSQIAKQFGGGGHKGASGFIIDDITKILNNYICINEHSK